MIFSLTLKNARNHGHILNNNCLSDIQNANYLTPQQQCHVFLVKTGTFKQTNNTQKIDVIDRMADKRNEFSLIKLIP